MIILYTELYTETLNDTSTIALLFLMHQLHSRRIKYIVSTAEKYLIDIVFA